MKSLFPFIAVISILTSCSTSRVPSQSPYSNSRAQQSFYYYPSSNVYYDGSCSRYIYHNGRSWVTASVLPSGVFIGNDRVQVYYNGPEVWRDNNRHRQTYYKGHDDRGRNARYRDRRYGN